MKRHIFPIRMNTGSGRFENSVPHGGFKIDRRKDALVPMWADDDLNLVRPFEDSPCLHRVVANMQTDADSILTMANKFGLLIAAPESLDLWRQEIRTLRNLKLPKLAEKLSAVRFRLVPVEENGAVVLRYSASRFIDAIHQRFAEEFAGLIQCARCPAPNCGRWFLKSDGRGDRRFCSHPCKMRAWRA
jgi:hypothetical protein